MKKFAAFVMVVFAWVVLSEDITVYFIIGSVLIIAGMFLSNKK